MYTSLCAVRAAFRSVPRLTTGVLLLLALTSRTHAQSYAISDLGVLSGQTNSTGLALSANGTVSGLSGSSVFYWNGSLHDTGQSGSRYSGGTGINNAGQVLVSSRSVYSIVTGLTFDIDNLYYGYGINSTGQVAGIGDGGYTDEFDNEIFHAYRWTPTTPNGSAGTAFDIDGRMGGYASNSRANAINDAGEVCGFKDVSSDSDYNYYFAPFVWAGGSPGLTNLGYLSGDGLGAALGISSFGHVVGQTQSYYIDDDGFGDREIVITGTHAFLWTPTTAHGVSGSMQAVGSLGGDSTANGVNSIPQVVGTSSGKAFVWDATGGIRDLNALIPSPSAWTLYTANAINEAGQITGTGTIGGQTHAFLLTPKAAAPAVAVSRIAVSPNTVYKGAETFGKVTLVSNAPAGGETVALSSSNGAVMTPPASVLVPARHNSATFAIGTGSVSADTTVTLTATAGGAAASAKVTVLTRYTVSGTISGSGTDRTVSAAASGSFLLTASASPNAAVPDNSAGGVTSMLPVAATGTISSVVVGLNITHPHIGDLVVTLVGPDGTSIVLQNKMGGSNQNLVTSYPRLFAPVQSLSAFNGKTAGGTWTLKVQDLHTGSAGTLNFWNLTFQYDGILTQTAAVHSDGTFSIPSLKAGTYAVMPAGAGLSFAPASRTVTVGPNATGVNFSEGLAIQSLVLSSSKKTGGNTVTGTVTLASTAPSGGQSVALSSSNTEAVTVPASVTVAAGQTTATFALTTKPTPSPITTTITANTGGTPATAKLTVNPGMKSVTVSPGTAKGGSHPTGTVTLSGPAASDLTIGLASSGTGILTVPASVLVATGATYATFPVTTYKVTATTTVTVSATLGLVKTKTVTVTP